MKVKAEGKIWEAIGMIGATIEVGDLTGAVSTMLVDALELLRDAIKEEGEKDA